MRDEKQSKNDYIYPIRFFLMTTMTKMIAITTKVTTEIDPAITGVRFAAKSNSITNYIKSACKYYKIKKNTK